MASHLDRRALLRALRAALVIPAVFALALTRFGPEAGTFAAFGAFALLLFVDFSGTLRTRLVAYLVLAAAGAGLVVLGTLCSPRVETAVAGMVLVGFGVVFAGAVNGYFAAATTAALLAFVLPVTIPAATAPVGDRLLGWLLACVVSIPAALLLWPQRGRDELRAASARTCAALADVLLAAGSPDLPGTVQRSREAVAGLNSRVVATPYRTTGPTRTDLALASLVDEVGWLPPFVLALAAEPPAESDGVSREAMVAAAATLRSVAGTLGGARQRPDLTRLHAAREALLRRSETPVELARAPEPTAWLDTAFRLRVVTSLTRTIAELADVAGGGRAARAALVSLRGTTEALRATGGIAADLASPRAVWFRNSLRAGVGLGLAVLVAQVAELQHAFWAVLGTLSVLRSSALGTGRTALRAIAGTLLGLVVGSALMVAIGSDEPLLWVVLPIVVFLAGYGPTVSFLAGQAAFTVTVVVLFNLIQPAGWRVGLIRVEDVLVGSVVAIGVGLLFWPRGAARVLADSLATAYATGAELVRSSGRRLLGGAAPDLAETERATRTALRRVDDAFRQFVAERSGSPVDVASLARAVSGAVRLRLTAESLGHIRSPGTGPPPVDGARLLDGDLTAVHRWYASAAEALAGRAAVPDPEGPGVDRAELVRAGLRREDGRGVPLVWAGEYLEELRQLEHRVAPAITVVTEQSHAPWWR